MAKKNLPEVSFDQSEVNYTGYIFSPHADRPVLLNHVLHWDQNPLLYTFKRDLEYLDFVVSLLETHLPDDAKARKKIHDVLSQKKVHPPEVGRTLAQVLGAFQTIILDEIDRLIVTDEAIHFMETFVSELSSQEKILVANGRTANLSLWANLREQHLVVIINENGEDAYYNRPLPLVEVKLFGTPSITVNGKVYTEFDGPLPASLTYYFSEFILRTRDEIFEDFWPELNTKEATNVFHVTKRKISERLGVEITVYQGGFYRPSPGISIVSDVRQFEEAFKKGDWKTCVDLYRTGFLTNVKVDMDWMKAKRQEYELNYVDALVNLGRQEENAGRFDSAIRYFLETLPVQVREDAVRAAMSLYHQLGQDDEAIELYERLVTRLSRVKLEHGKRLKPDPKTEKLYNIITKK